MKSKKIISLLLSILLISSVFTGCNSNSQSSKNSGSDSKGSQKDDITPVDPANNMPKAGTSFKMWIPMKAGVAKDFVDMNDMNGTKILEEKTGVKVDYVSPAQGQETQQFNLLMATPDELPDVIAFDVETGYPGGVAAAVEDGVLIDATDLIKKYAPNFMNYLKKDKTIQKDAYSDGGSIVTFGKKIVSDGMRNLPFNGMIVNQNFLDKAKLDIPTTIDDWEKVLKAFKDQGVKEPLTFTCNNLFQPNGLNEAFSSAYGVAGGPRFYQENGKAKYAPLENGYKQWIELFRKWYADGLIDPDFVSKQKEVATDLQNAKAGSACLHLSNLKKIPDLSVKAGLEKTIVNPAPYPVLKTGDTINFRSTTEAFSGRPFFITTKAKNPEEIVKWIDYLYSKDGFVACNWGIKGSSDMEDTYKENPDGSKEYVGEALGYMQAGKSAFVTAQDLIIYWDWDYQKNQYYNTDMDTKAFNTWNKATNNNAMPTAIALTPEEATEYSNLKSDIDVYVIENTAKFIMGKEPMEKYDDYLNTLKQMGAEKMLKIQQDALDRYNKRA